MQIMKRFWLVAGLAAATLAGRAQIVSFPHLESESSEEDTPAVTAVAEDTIVVRDVTKVIEESFREAMGAEAQMPDISAGTVGTVVSRDGAGDVPVVLRYGYCNRQALIAAQPEYAVAMAQLEVLRKQYEEEVEHNEADFRRQFTEYLYGQKEFPQAILLKRQRDLQAAMEQGLAFRAEADALLQKAEHDLVAPIGARVDAAIGRVAAARGYAYVLDTASGAYLYLHPRLAEDISEYVKEELR